MKLKFKSSLAAIAIVAPIATVVACGDETDTKVRLTTTTVLQTNVPAETRTYLMDADLSMYTDLSDPDLASTSTASKVVQGTTGIMNDQMFNINVVDSVDFIQTPALINVNSIGKDLLEFAVIADRGEEVEAVSSPLITYATSDPSWEVVDGKVTKFDPATTATLTITIGSATATTTLLSRADIVNVPIIPGFGEAKAVSDGQTPANEITVSTVNDVAGVTYSKDILHVEYADSDTSSPRVDPVVNLYPTTVTSNPDNRAIIDPTAPYLGMLVYIPDTMTTENIWFRSNWNNPSDTDATHGVGLDFTENNSDTFDEGWHLFEVNIFDSGIFVDPENYLTTLRPILLSAKSLTGEFYVANIFQSDEHMNVDDLLATLI